MPMPPKKKNMGSAVHKINLKKAAKKEKDRRTKWKSKLKREDEDWSKQMRPNREYMRSASATGHKREWNRDWDPNSGIRGYPMQNNPSSGAGRGGDRSGRNLGTFHREDELWGQPGKHVRKGNTYEGTPLSLETQFETQESPFGSKSFYPDKKP